MVVFEILYFCLNCSEDYHLNCSLKSIALNHLCTPPMSKTLFEVHSYIIFIMMREIREMAHKSKVVIDSRTASPSQTYF